MNIEDDYSYLFRDEYPAEIAKKMRETAILLALDIDFDTDGGCIEDVLNGIDYHRKSFEKRLSKYDEYQKGDIVGAAIGIACYEKFVDD